MLQAISLQNAGMKTPQYKTRETRAAETEKDRIEENGGRGGGEKHK